MNEQEKDTQMRKLGRPYSKLEDIKLISVAKFPEGKVKTIKLTSINDFHSHLWDKDLKIEIKFYAELRSQSDMDRVIEFLQQHRFDIP